MVSYKSISSWEGGLGYKQIRILMSFSQMVVELAYLLDPSARPAFVVTKLAA
jgi:hypothetical protein